MSIRLILISALSLAQTLSASIQLASPFTEHMVLQRELPIPVWGTGTPGETVTINFAGHSKSTTIPVSGKWSIELDALTASAEPRTFVVSGASDKQKITLSDVLVGEVWLASGQSNMVFTLSKSRYRWAGVVDEENVIAQANHPLIRMLTVDEQKAYTPQTQISGKWQVCTSENAPAWSAIGYFFAKNLQEELQVPIGIISSSYGASCAQAWIRRESMLDDPELKAVLDRFDEQVKGYAPPTDAELKDWEHAVELAKAEGRRTPSRPGKDPIQDQHNPTVMYNGMIAPLVPYSIRGVIWYQGESITSPRELFPRWNKLLVQDWRELWGREIPFLACQLAALDKNSNSPQVRHWQEQILELPSTGLAITIDVGDKHDVHPHDKEPVGERLAALALAKAYDQDILYDGPRPTEALVSGNEVHISFENLAEGLIARNGPLKTFEIADAKGDYHPALATIVGNQVVVTNENIQNPKSVRYAWDRYPEGCNFYNSAGLPAAPFQISVNR